MNVTKSRTRNRILPTLTVAAAIGTLAVGAWASASAAADTGGEPGARDARGAPYSVERVAMRNLIVRQLAQRTGRPESEIDALLKSSRPQALARTLGLDRDAMKEILLAARATLIDEAVQAQMITVAQADALRKAPPPERFGHRPRSGEGPRGPANLPLPDDDGE